MTKVNSLGGQRGQYLLYSDGGGERNTAAAAACIVEDSATKQRAFFVTYLGPGTNNEAEISGALLGFSFLKALSAQPKEIRWVSDSEYALKSGTEYIHAWQRNGWRTAAKSPVKNQGLWRAFLTLTEKDKITAEHVRGHSGHPENEACDAISTWCQLQGEAVLAENGNGVAVLGREEISWRLLDGRNFLENLRVETPNDEAMTMFVSSLGELRLDSMAEGLPQSKTTKQTSGKQQSGLISVTNLLLQAKLQAEKLGSEVPGAEELAQSLEQLLAQYPDQKKSTQKKST